MAVRGMLIRRALLRAAHNHGSRRQWMSSARVAACGCRRHHIAITRPSTVMLSDRFTKPLLPTCTLTAYARAPPFHGSETGWLWVAALAAGCHRKAGAPGGGPSELRAALSSPAVHSDIEGPLDKAAVADRHVHCICPRPR